MKKAARKSTTGAENGRKSVGNFSTRFSLPSFVKRVEKLTDVQKTAIKRMGFGNLLQMPNLTLNKNLLVELMERWNCEKLAFVLLPGEITINLMDVAVILGLRVTGDPVFLKEDEPFSQLEKEYGASLWKRKITITSLDSRLESLGGIVNDDFIRSFILYTFGTFLFPNANGKVDSRYLSLLSDLDNVCQYDWGSAVLEDLFMWLCKRKENNVQYVGGCLLFLQIWSYEHIDIARPSLLDCFLTIPRACRWENSRSHQRQWFTTKFKELQENQIIWKLQLTSEESELDIIKELLEAKNDMKELPRPQYSSADVSGFDEAIECGRIGSQLMDQQVAELDYESEMEIVREEVSVQEDMEQQRASQNVPEVLIDPMESPSTSDCMSQIEKGHGEHPSTTLVSSLNFTIGNEDDLRTRNHILEAQMTELKEEIDELKRENEILRSQLLSSPPLEEQNVELRREVDNLRRENQLLSLSANNLVIRLERLVFDEDINATVET
ncbi:hypothetical protein L1049_007830 [Liquidambar formosana]|uniref:Aminotransferase-like plant mobile domain-containing protein n=1 Tax=Liquidambar formosana TaxID=63359 RepID=A0AAP0X509_LIQFO